MKNTVSTLILVASLLGCGQGSLIQCKADALRALPERVDEVTSGNLVELYENLQACHAPSPDAGR